MKLLSRAVATIALAALPGAVALAAPVVEIETSMGAMTLELDAERAPKTVANFLQYAKDGFYKGTIFHRVIPGFMVQGGGFTPDMQQKPTREPVPIESRNGLKNLTGTIAMARTRDPNSATAQFFINVVDNAMLDHPKPDGHGYTVFGRVTRGMEVAQKIVEVPTRSVGPFQDVPATPITISNVRIVKAD
ncbi:MAG: peptidylprolyl isomerase [Burkholderiales bacterium]|jgi:peptidyl-prolyl cis-trans isomerase A (cyclophilin A)|nr:peptidylprolyl isomerase [Burkholderiales bacterium]